MDVSSLSNEELREQLLAHGINPGPVVATTRRVYEAKLLKAMGEGSSKSRSTGGSPSKSRQSGVGAEPHVEQISRSRRQVAKAAAFAADEPVDNNGEEDDDDENYEGEESFRLVDTHDSYSTGGSRYRGAYGSNDSPPSKSFLSDTYSSSYGSGSNRYGSASSRESYGSATYKSGDAGSSKGGTSVPIWLKLLLLVALTVFIFFIIQRVIENAPPADVREDEQV